MAESNSSPRSPSPPVDLDHVPLALQDVIRSYLPATTDVSGKPHPENHHVETIAPRDLGYFFYSEKMKKEPLKHKVLGALCVVVGSILTVLFWKAQWWLLVYMHGSEADASSQWTPINFFRPVQLFYCSVYALILLVDWISYLFVWRMHRAIYSKLTLFRNPYAPNRCLVYNADLDAVAAANANRRERSSSLFVAGSIAMVYLLPQACQVLWSYFFMWPMVTSEIALRGAPDNGWTQWSSALSAPGVREWLLPQSLICDPAADPSWSAWLLPCFAYLSLWRSWPRMSASVFWTTLCNPRRMLWGFQAALYLATTVAMLAAATFPCLMLGCKGFGGRRGRTVRRAPAPEPPLDQEEMDVAMALAQAADPPPGLPLLLMPGAAELAQQHQQQHAAAQLCCFFFVFSSSMSALLHLRHAASLTFGRLHSIPRGWCSLLPSPSLPPPPGIARRMLAQSRRYASSSLSASSPTSPQAAAAVSPSAEADSALAADFSAADLPATVRHQFRGSPPLPPLGTAGQLDAASITRLLRDLSAQADSLRAEHQRLTRLSSYLHELAQASVGSQMNRAAIMQHEGLIARTENCAAQLQILQQQLELDPQHRSASAIAAACAELQPYHIGSGQFAFDFSVDYSFMQMNAAKMG